jgi:hypothetical protein
MGKIPVAAGSRADSLDNQQDCFSIRRRGAQRHLSRHQ